MNIRMRLEGGTAALLAADSPRIDVSVRGVNLIGGIVASAKSSDMWTAW